jgi:two-component system, OmpR family, alkaline phosphatase synthesis response regulator PhoP
MNEKSKILIIEDDDDLVMSMKKILESKGYDVSTAYDPEEGVKVLKLDNPDIIILDVMFGNKGETKGFDFAQNIKLDKKYAGIPILMLTAINSVKPSFNFSPETDGEFLPVDSFLDKPVLSDELIHKVEYLLKQKTSKWQNWPQKEV